MGQAADDMTEGFACSWCGTYFSSEHGYPVLCKDCFKESTPSERDGLPKATNPELCEDVNL